MVFDDFLLQKAVSVDSFTKMEAKCLRPGFGLGRAGWAGLGWAGPGLCLGLVLLTSGAKARKSSNRDFLT